MVNEFVDDNRSRTETDSASPSSVVLTVMTKARRAFTALYSMSKIPVQNADEISHNYFNILMMLSPALKSGLLWSCSLFLLLILLILTAGADGSF